MRVGVAPLHTGSYSYTCGFVLHQNHLPQHIPPEQLIPGGSAEASGDRSFVRGVFPAVLFISHFPEH